MSDVYLQPISSSNKNNQHYDNIDLCNEDTFGAGAIEGDWELDHAHHVGLQRGESWKGNANDIGLKSGLKRDLSDDLEPFNFDSFHSPSQLDDDELERSNQQLAAAVEELVLNSDQDQDMIDPAIVSLRRQPQATHLAASPKLPPLYSCDENQMKFNNPNISTLFSRPDNLYTSDNMKNIWNESSLGQSILTASLAMPVDNKPSNENGNLQFEV
uniref:Uncharacterized protein n=1 Tax=Ciona savignyi TaxID=51511 RepID=H2YFN2_CIOSA